MCLKISGGGPKTVGQVDLFLKKAAGHVWKNEFDIFYVPMYSIFFTCFLANQVVLKSFLSLSLKFSPFFSERPKWCHVCSAEFLLHFKPSFFADTYRVFHLHGLFFWLGKLAFVGCFHHQNIAKLTYQLPFCLEAPCRGREGLKDCSGAPKQQTNKHLFFMHGLLLYLSSFYSCPPFQTFICFEANFFIPLCQSISRHLTHGFPVKPAGQMQRWKWKK